MAKHRRKVEARQLQEAIETGMVQAKGLGKKKRREASKSGWLGAAGMHAARVHHQPGSPSALYPQAACMPILAVLVMMLAGAARSSCKQQAACCRRCWLAD